MKQQKVLPAKVALSPGHIPSKPGCLSFDGKITEHECTNKAANMLKAMLSELKINSNIITNPDDPLEQIGHQADGYGMFISLHFNAMNRKSNYTSVLIDSRYTIGNSKNTLVASLAAVAMAHALELPLYEGYGYPKGVMPATLRVLSAAHKTDCPYVFLAEPFFLDCYSNADEIDAMIAKAMRALANVVKEVLCP